MNHSLGTDIRFSRREKYFLYNTLSVLLKAVEGQRTTIDIRNESSIFGTVEHVDGFMNVVMKDCIFVDPRGHSFKYDMFFIQARNIRSVQIPTQMRIIPTIKSAIENMSSKPIKTNKQTFKSKRTRLKQKEELSSVQKLLSREK